MDIVANGDLMEIKELYKIALTVLLMNTADTSRLAMNGKLAEQAPLTFPCNIKPICS